MKRMFFAVALVASLVGCGGGDPCGRQSACANDTKKTDADIQACRANLKTAEGQPCYGEVLAYGNCILDNQVCGADGKTDGSASQSKASSACTSALANGISCCAKNPTSKACSGG